MRIPAIVEKAVPTSTERASPRRAPTTVRISAAIVASREAHADSVDVQVVADDHRVGREEVQRPQREQRQRGDEREDERLSFAHGGDRYRHESAEA